MKELTIIEILNGHEPQLLRSHQSCEFCPVEVLLEYLHGTFAPDAMKGTRMSDASEIQVKMETLVQDIGYLLGLTTPMLTFPEMRR